MPLTPTPRGGSGTDELRGAVVLALIGLTVLAAFALSPVGTIAAMLVGFAAYMHHDVASRGAHQGLVWRVSVGLAVAGTVAALMHFS